MPLWQIQERSTKIKLNNFQPQLPGTFERADVTEVLARKTFWPSYNSPYFPGLWFNSDLAYIFTSPLLQTSSTSLATGSWLKSWEIGSHMTKPQGKIKLLQTMTKPQGEIKLLQTMKKTQGEIKLLQTMTKPQGKMKVLQIIPKPLGSKNFLILTRKHILI